MFFVEGKLAHFCFKLESLHCVHMFVEAAMRAARRTTVSHVHCIR